MGRLSNYILSLIALYIVVAIITFFVLNLPIRFALFGLLSIVALVISIYFYLKETNFLFSLSITFINGILTIIVPVLLSVLGSDILDGEKGMAMGLLWVLGIGVFIISIIINGIISFIKKH